MKFQYQRLTCQGAKTRDVVDLTSRVKMYLQCIHRNSCNFLILVIELEISNVHLNVIYIDYDNRSGVKRIEICL